MTVFPPPLLSTWPLAVRLIIAGVMPVAFGLVCGAVLGGSGAVFLVLQAVGIGGGWWAGLEHVGRRAGFARGVSGGLLFGSSILAGHALAGGESHGLIPHPEALQVVITTSMGALLGVLGARSRQRIDGRRS
jgi:hypothetical protein